MNSLDNKVENAAVLFFYTVFAGGRVERAENLKSGSSGEPVVYRWLHLLREHVDAPSRLREIGLDELAIEGLLREETRPSTSALEQGILVSLRGVNLNTEQDPEDMVSLRAWLSEGLIVTVRQRRLKSVQELDAALVAGAPPPPQPGSVLALIVENLTDKIWDVVESIDDRLTDVESSSYEVRSVTLRKQLSSIRRQSATIRRYLAPQREALSALARDERILSVEERAEIHQQSDRLVRYIEELDLARERALVLSEELSAMIAEQQNARMYLLALLSAIFLPLSFATGLFGMNVAGMPWIENNRGFLYICIVLTGVAAVIALWMKRKRWF